MLLCAVVYCSVLSCPVLSSSAVLCCPVLNRAGVSCAVLNRAGVSRPVSDRAGPACLCVPDFPWEVRANGRSFHRQQQKSSFLCFHRGKYADNAVRSCKYSPLSFLPLNLFEQFQRVANLYFLVLVTLQLVPAISTLPWYITMLPLLMVLGVRAVKDLAADLARHHSDREINSRPCDVLLGDSFSTAQWKDICVGDIVRLHKDEVIPADLLLLSSSEPHSLCYVETADIDGETNLKFRQALPATHQELRTEPSLAAFQGCVLCEEPNRRLHSFFGELRWKEERHLLDAQHILLRGCVLRNTSIAYGLALYTGSDSKILQNAGRFSEKKTQVELILNRVVIGIVAFLLATALLLAVGAGVFEAEVSRASEVLTAVGGGVGPVYRAFLIFWGYIILLAPVLPMALYITFEVIHVLHSLLVGWDLGLYDERSDSPAHARTTTLNEELGQVQVLLTDKTGTLTENRLLFRQCCIAGRVYGNLPDSATQPEPAGPGSHSQARFSDPRLLERLRSQQCPEVWEFFRVLALCHTVMVDWKEGDLVYQAASPDEGALVGAARGLGWEFLSRTRDSLSLNELGRPRLYQLLAILDFSSHRRRMSVLVREPEGGLKLYCKGADTVILGRLREDCPHREATERALELFSEGCLRTLCMAVRSVAEESWAQWSRALHQAARAKRQGDELLEEVYDLMERELTLVGVTAIEDRLQDGVPETIAKLRQGGIKVWVLTGDKRETAVNIGYACRLLDADTRVLQGEELRELLSPSGPETDRPLDKGDNDLSWWATQRGGPGAVRTALVITGAELAQLGAEEAWGARLVALAQRCQSVLCCRVTPGQKAEVVRLVRKHTGAVTMAIGDGANDVNMIKTAHIGVGLSGVEGCQAVQCADFSLARFCLLQRLLLVHGRWSYRRICAFLHYFLFKTSSFAIVHAWFAFYNGFSGQPVYENWFITLYTVLYTIFPILCLAVLEQDVSAEVSLRCPELYHVGQSQQLLSPWLLGATLLHSLFASLVLFFLPLGVFYSSALDYQTFAITVATSAIFTSTGEIVLQTGFWTKYNVGTVVLSLALYFAITFFLHSPRLHQAAPNDYYFPGVSINALSNPLVWLTILLTSVTALLPSFTARALRLVLSSPSMHRVHSSEGPVELQAAFRRGDSHRRSSYAVSQGRGFGQLLTSGARVHNTAPQQDGRGTAGVTTSKEMEKLEKPEDK
ncbi:phospholipid-transporting ATPase IC isoform X2 [Lepisosteus oculatus]|uniref:phospholipid-transporting ATPase IC isoform X2 n=1 Tax=Lepisosteus oculatus TaxID=7918 RepID=UPI00371EA4B4